MNDESIYQTLRPDLFLIQNGMASAPCLQDRNKIARFFSSSPRWSQKARKSDLVYYGLKEKIVMSHLGPSEILGEQQIAAEFDCAQGTVREALIRLEHIGLVVRHDFKGTHVSDMILNEAQQMVLIRRQLETVAARHIAQKLSDDVAAALLVVAEAMYLAAKENRVYLCSEYDRYFHTTLFHASGFWGLEPVLTRCLVHMHRYTLGSRSKPLNAPSIREQHVGILESIQNGSEEDAARTVESHISLLVNQWSPELQEEDA
ncbi:GntR family transcriptional regulator [Pseudovibrio flavus]|uniref:GntR family transcriptional regulator n=1 Tax=Pseudovibrio flavus TaxID=2529854 RepID=UPI00211CE062|nr:GntR family transcriptional regulator [Pseudovibrio flavus]